MALKKIQFTKEGYYTLQKEHSELQSKRKEAVQELKTAREMGDLSENAAYKAARPKLSSIDSRIRRLNSFLERSEIIEPAGQDKIGLGSKVQLKDNDKTYKYTLVGSYEADLDKGKISSFSPLGRALLGKKAGDTITFSTPSGTISYRILKVF